jgi:hypothetical protein
MLCTWARDYGIIGTGIDMSQLFTDMPMPVRGKA